MSVLELSLASDSLAPFALRLRAWRAARGYSQRKLAEMSGVHHVTIGRLESGAVAAPDWGVALKLAEALGVEINAFAEGGPLPEPPSEPEPVEEPRPRPRGKLK